MLCQKQIDNFFDTSYGNKEIFFIKLRVQGLHKNPVKTASAKSDETIFLKYQVYRKEQLYMGKKVLKADTVVKNYWRNNEQFADIFNAVLFNGNEVIKILNFFFQIQLGVADKQLPGRERSLLEF